MSSLPASARTRRFLEGVLGESATPLSDRAQTALVRITVAGDRADGFTAQAITFTLVNMLVRLNEFMPNLEVVIPACTRHTQIRQLGNLEFGKGLEEFVRPFAAASRIALIERPTSATALFRLGIGPRRTNDIDLNVWAEGWIAYLNAEPTQHVDQGNPVGACAAAGFAAAGIFKWLIEGRPLRPGVIVLPIDRLVFSTYDYGLGEGPNPEMPSDVSLDRTVLVGAGGIGSAFVAAAALLSSFSGVLDIVDDDPFDDTNMNRHLIGRPGDRGSKAQRCAEVLRFNNDVRACDQNIESYLAERGDRNEVVAVAVDDDGVRRSIQGSLPRIVINAATSDYASFRLTRHSYEAGACLSCISRADLVGDPTVNALARRLGLAAEVIDTHRKAATPFSRTTLEAGGKLSDADLRRFSERTVEEIWQMIYNEAPVLARGEEAPSISFLSALPGFLLLGEVIKEHTFTADRRPPLNETFNYLTIAVLGRPHPDLLRDYRGKREGCDCRKSAWQSAYRRKWRLSGTSTE